MWIALDWPQASLDHIARHDVTRSEVERALEGRLYKRKSGHRIIVVANAGNRCLFVVLRPSALRPGFAEVATARDASRSEKRLFASRGKT